MNTRHRNVPFKVDVAQDIKSARQTFMGSERVGERFNPMKPAFDILATVLVRIKACYLDTVLNKIPSELIP